MKKLKLGDKSVNLQIWDTAGQERFRTITKTYYTNSHGIMLTYSVTDQKSFLNIQNWIKQIQANAQNNICKILVGNKCDCKPEERKVSFQEGQKLAEEFGLEFFEVSAKNDINVEESFMKLTEVTMNVWGDKMKGILKKKRSNTVLSKEAPKQNKCCK
ncbi:MAG: GTP-binding protein [archaeon]|nr:GTP-binding protein [archaeon]